MHVTFSIRECDKSYSMQAIETNRQLANLLGCPEQTCSLGPRIRACSDWERIRRYPESGCVRIIYLRGLLQLPASR
jgi:hypothetical protein